MNTASKQRSSSDGLKGIAAWQKTFSILENRETQAGEIKMRNEYTLETDVLVVGYGPVGACLSALLGKSGTKTLVIDKLAEIWDTPRAIALDNEALRILQMLEINQNDFEQVSIQEVRMKCPYVGEFGRANTTGTINGHPKLVTFYQPELEKALRKNVMQYPSVQIQLQTELLDLKQTKNAVIATLRNSSGEEYKVKSKYVVGADGASSRVRNIIGQDFEGETYREDWLVVDAKRKRDKPMNYVEFVCDPKRPTPHMPAPGERERWEFMLHPDEDKYEMEKDERINELLSSWQIPEELTLERQAAYRFHARCCDSFQKDRVFLVGDAAHVTPPFVGQGLVAGLRDAANLAWKLSWTIDKNAHPFLLNSYDLERRPHAKEMIDLAKFMGNLVMPRSAIKAILIHGTMRLLRLIPPIRPYFDELKIKPPNQFKNGLFVKGKSKAGFVPGALLPQETLNVESGVAWSDDVLERKLVLIGFGTDPKTNIDHSTLRQWEKLGGSFLHIRARGHESKLKTHSAEPVGELFSKAAKTPWIVAVRPDQVVLADGPARRSNKVVHQAMQLMCG